MVARKPPRPMVTKKAEHPADWVGVGAVDRKGRVSDSSNASAWADKPARKSSFDEDAIAEKRALVKDV